MQFPGLVWLGSALRILSCLVMAIGAGAGFPDPAGAEEPPPSLVSVAAAAQAAAIVIRAAGEGGSSSPLHFVRDADGGPLSALSTRRGRSLGAGVIVDPRGFALASARVVRQANGFEVALIDGTPLEATVVGLDLRTDVAVLKLQADVPLPYLPLGNSDRVRGGEWVIAVSAPAGLEGTVSAGVITATPAPDSSSPLAGLFQTDAVIGRGAPIVAMNGEVIALGTAARGDRVGYALPANIVRTIYLELVEKGRVRRPWLGVTIQSLTADLARALGVRVDVGALIADVLPRGPAARAHLRSGDVILEVGGTPVSSRTQVDRAISRLKPGQAVLLKIRRTTREIMARIELGEEPDEWEIEPAVDRARRLLGLDVRPITPAMGTVVVNVEPESPADFAGLEPGDVLREINHRSVGRITDLQAIAQALRPSTDVLVLVQRGDLALYIVLRARE